MTEVDIIISNGLVLTMDENEAVIENSAVAIDGENIVAVGKLEEIKAGYMSREIIDATNHLIMPGLINSHTHAAMTCFRGIADDIELMDWLNNYIFPAEAKNVNVELVFWGSLLACAEMVKSGTTTFCDMYIFEDETAKAAKEAGMRCLLGEVLFDFPSPNIKTPAEGLEYTRMLIEKWADDPLINIMVEPHSLYTCSPSLLIDAKALADQYNIPLATHFLENMAKYSDRRQLTVETMRMVGMPIFLTTITTMAGFASLTWTEVLPMRQMGIFVSLGVGYAGFIALFFLPAVLSRIKLPTEPPPSESRLPRLILAASRHRRSIVVGFLVIVAISAFNIPRLDVVSNQLMFFKADSEIRQTFDKVEEHFGGALFLTGEIVADRGLDTLRDYDFAEDVLDMERDMERLPGVKSVLSIFDMVAGINEMATGKDEYPESPRIIQRFLTQIDDEDLVTWVSDDGLRLMIKTEDLDSLDMDKLESFVAEHSEIRLISGMPVLFEEMNRLVVQSQTRSLFLALALVFLMLLITIRRFFAALIALLPIVITIGAIMGMLVMTGFHLNVMTANLSAITVGVGVDYAIHLISGIYYFRRQGLGRGESVDSALLSLSRPILAIALGLAIGLSVLFFSPLRIHMQAASVMWVAMVVSSMAALLLIPIFYTGVRSRKLEA